VDEERKSLRFIRESFFIGGNRRPSYAGVVDFRWEVGCNESASDVECLRRDSTLPPECLPLPMPTSFAFISFDIFFGVATLSRFENENDLRVAALVASGAVDDRFRVVRDCVDSSWPICVAGRDSMFREAASVNREFVSSSLSLSVGKLLIAVAVTRVGPKCRLKKSGTIRRMPGDLVSFAEPEP
jgi:hypothetical protein